MCTIYANCHIGPDVELVAKNNSMCCYLLLFWLLKRQVLLATFICEANIINKLHHNQ